MLGHNNVVRQMKVAVVQSGHDDCRINSNCCYDHSEEKKNL